LGDMNHLNALCASPYGGHEKVVQLLLNNSNDVNAQDGWYGNMVQVAAERGHEKAVEPLFNNGAT
jgi:ankyrin repeat protein